MYAPNRDRHYLDLKITATNILFAEASTSILFRIDLKSTFGTSVHMQVDGQLALNANSANGLLIFSRSFKMMIFTRVMIRR